ncbi:MAG TPA: tetratricopeptide repeat protein [Ktedonobacterales bacterium]
MDQHESIRLIAEGQLLFKQHQYQKALEAAEHAIALDPGYASAQNNKAAAISHLKHPEDARWRALDDIMEAGSVPDQSQGRCHSMLP